MLFVSDVIKFGYTGGGGMIAKDKNFQILKSAWDIKGIIQVCTPNETRCDEKGYYIEKCKSDGSGWDNYYQYCSSGCMELKSIMKGAASKAMCRAKLGIIQKVQIPINILGIL